MNILSKQKGFVLFMTLMVMVLMSIGGLALFRAVDTSTLVAGNIGYKQAAIISADSAIKVAADAMAIAATLSADNAAIGFYATANTTLDWTGQNTPADPTDDVEWVAGTNAAAPTKATQVIFPPSIRSPSDTSGRTDTSGNRAYYVVNRLCDTAGPSGALGTSCATNQSVTVAAGGTKAGAAYGAKALTTTSQVYYRITIKVVGPKNTVSYSQVFRLI